MTKPRMTAKGLREEAQTMSELALKTLAAIMEGIGQDAVKLAAAREVLDWAHGKPKATATRAKPKPSKTAHDSGMTVIVKRFSDDAGQEDSGETITVPTGASTDLASIPRLAWSLLPADGPWAKAAVIHDFLYRTRGTGAFAGQRWISRPRDYTRAESDRILDEAMAVLGVPTGKRVLIFEAVRLGGGLGWGR